MTKLGIFGGTFDPVHLGHINLITKLQETYPLSKILIVPCHQPVHRAMPHASTKDRLAMLHLAFDPLPYCTIDEREIRRPGPSLMYDTLNEIAKEEPDADLHLILGADAWENFKTWKHWEALIAKVHLLVVSRPGTPFTDIPAPRIQYLDGFNFMPSATAIRKAIQEDAPLNTLLPPLVSDYIHSKHLYCA